MQENPLYQTKENIKQKQRLWKRIVAGLACMVVFSTTYMLILPAITQEQTAYCGIEEHQHDESCYEKKLVCNLEESTSHIHTDACYEEQQVLVCGKEESSGHVHTADCIHQERVLICSEDHEHTDACYQNEDVYICGLNEGDGAHTHGPECYQMQKVLTCKQQEGEAHTHTDACYEKVLTCQKEEHEHTLACFSDPTADVETQVAWEKTMAGVTLTGVWSDDVLAIAKSQLGYEESTRNYIVTEEGATKGYSRYGAWYGDPYGDWCAMFVSFCLKYAGVKDYPLEASCPKWIEKLAADANYQAQGSYDPKPGDLIFFDIDRDGTSDHIGIVDEINKAEDTTKIKTIEGNSSDRVQYVTYAADNPIIMGYGILPDNPEIEEPVVTPEPTAAPEEIEDSEAEDEETDAIYAPMDSTGEKVSVDTCNLTLTLNLSWPNDKNPELTVYLINQSTGEQVQKVTIEQNSSKKEVSITGLPRVDADGNEIQYGVELEKVSGYVGGYTLDTSDFTNTWDENSTLWVKASKIEAGKSYLLLTSDAVGPGNSQFIRANSIIVPKEMLSEDVALSAGPITAANGTAYSPYLKADANGIGGALWTAQKSDDGFSFYSNYLTEKSMPGYYLDTANSLNNNDKKGTKWKFDSKNQTISASKETLYPFEKVDPAYGTVRTVNMNVDISYTSIGQAEENWQEYTTIRVVKQWQDADGNPITAGLPDSLKVTLTADGLPSSLQDAEVTLTADNNWTHEWSVPRYSFDSGLKHEIQYAVEEEAVDGFTQSETRSEDVYGDTITAWVLTDDFEDNTEFILTTSPLTGTVGALTAASDGAHWADGKQSTVNVKSGSLMVNGVTYSQYILDPGENVIWKTGTGKEMTAQQHGTHKMWTLYNAKVNGYLKNNGQGDISSDVKQECWFYYNWYTGTPGKRPPSNPSSEWSNVLGSYNDYFLLSNNHTGDGGAETAQTFWLYKKVEAQPVVHQITLVNSQQNQYELPATGGSGTTPFTLCGLGLMTVAGTLMYRYYVRRRRERREC